MKIEELLNMLGNETRRGILQMLSERPYYVTEISQELDIGQKAIIEHLSLMRGGRNHREQIREDKEGEAKEVLPHLKGRDVGGVDWHRYVQCKNLVDID